MKDDTARALNQINRDFYRDRARDFERTRRTAWPGWLRLLPHLETLPGTEIHLLDVGCGSGRFGSFLAQHLRRPFVYSGIDASARLLEDAERVLAEIPHRLDCLDLVERAPAQALPPGPFQAIVAFGLLHHIPGEGRRRELIEAMTGRLVPGGLLALAFWDFGVDPRFDRRRMAWTDVPIDPAELEPGDALLRWGSEDDRAVRYCHHCDESEEARLLAALSLVDVDRYRSDGAEGTANRYRVLSRF